MGHLNKTFYSYMTTQDAWDEYNDLLENDSDFYIQWNVPYSDDEDKPYSEKKIEQMTQDNFKEWCEAHEIVLVDTQEKAKQLEEAQLE